ncbi:MAG: aspartate aminotransferase family protein [Spirochaetia bacterium]|nr:aspartate aminotransferase family protein [Spirochaetia bacterium]
MPMSNDNILLTHIPESKEKYLSMMSETVKAVSDVFVDDSAYSGTTPWDLHEVVHQDSILLEEGLGWEETLNKIKEQILPYLLRTSSSDYMAHLHGPSLLETLAGEVIISAFNQSMDSWDQSPVATEVELEVIRHLCRLYGYNKSADGVFTSGGSQSNQTAITLARDWFCNRILKHDVQKKGLPDNFHKLRMYVSEISHFSMEQSAHLLGLGYEAVVHVPVDSKKRMDVTALRQLIKEDKERGNIPFLIAATAGTTDYGSIDPIKELVKIGIADNMWIHADAAYGSGVVMSDKYRDRIKDLSLCDSITVDFHKMFLMPISCSVVLLKKGSDFDVLTFHANYLNRIEDEADGYTNLVNKSLQTTRRFDALKVWLSFQMRGQDGWNKLINTSMENAQYLYSLLANDKAFQVVTEPEISSVVFRYVGDDPERADEINRRVRRLLMHKHGVVIGQTTDEDNIYLKFTLLNPLITHKKLDDLVTLIKFLAENLPETDEE